MLAETFLRVEGQFPLIGVGGIDSADAALTKLRAGASLLQFYSAMVFKGPDLVREIKAGLLRAAQAENLSSIAAITGRDAEGIARS